MTRAQIIGVVIFLALAILVVLALGKPRTKVEPQKTETAIQEQVLPEKGKYELPPSQESPEFTVTQKEAAALASGTSTTTTVRKKAGAASEETKEEDKGYDSIDPALPPQPPILPPEDKLRDMQKGGIIVF